MKLIAETNKAPEIERCVSKNDKRPALSHAFLNVESGTLEATDSYKAVVVPVEIEDGDTGGLIPVEALKAQRKASTKHSAASLSVSGHTVRLVTSEGESVWKSVEGQFPNLPQVSPIKMSRFRVSLNPKYLLELAQALGSPEQVTVEFTRQRDRVEGDDTGAYPDNCRVMRITVPGGGESYGLLMPIRTGL